MVTRNLWSLEPGECVVAEELKKKIRSVQIYFPMRDVGTDLLAVRNETHVGIQVKTSRSYGDIGKAHGWHTLQARKLEQEDAEFYIFLVFGLTDKLGFENQFVIIPRQTLLKKAKKKPTSGGKYTFYFKIEGSKVTEDRDKPEDYSDFLNNWNLIDAALEKTR